MDAHFLAFFLLYNWILKSGLGSQIPFCSQFFVVVTWQSDKWKLRAFCFSGGTTIGYKIFPGCCLWPSYFFSFLISSSCISCQWFPAIVPLGTARSRFLFATIARCLIRWYSKSSGHTGTEWLRGALGNCLVHMAKEMVRIMPVWVDALFEAGQKNYMEGNPGSFSSQYGALNSFMTQHVHTHKCTCTYIYT